MKVIFRKPIIDRIIDAIESAANEGKVIEKIILTRSEWRSAMKRHPFLDADINRAGRCYFFGVRVEREGK